MTTPAPASPVAGALFADLFDDAGLFPPASLPLDEAFDAHRIASMGAYRWMLARFVLPATRVSQLAAVAPHYGDALRLSLIVDMDVDVDALAGTIDDHGWRAEAVEALLPDADVASSVKRLRGIADALGAPRAFLEVPWHVFPLDQLADAVAVLAGGEVGMKIRCGGATATDYPEPSLLASILRTCAAAGVATKATAGLHHPFRHPDPESGVLSHGFVNLLTAATLAATRDAAEPDLAAALAGGDRNEFGIGPDTLTWRDMILDASDIARARRELFLSIGSCSFREPVDDLVALGLLPVP